MLESVVRAQQRTNVKVKVSDGIFLAVKDCHGESSRPQLHVTMHRHRRRHMQASKATSVAVYRAHTNTSTATCLLQREKVKLLVPNRLHCVLQLSTRQHRTPNLPHQTHIHTHTIRLWFPLAVACKIENTYPECHRRVTGVTMEDRVLTL